MAYGTIKVTQDPFQRGDNILLAIYRTAAKLILFNVSDLAVTGL